ncbi:MAG: hypothetical protein P1U63_06610 [Coxiellaceae bacterium]|nr:hypothetical protein [Coxiellaceae bacterium]
MKFKLFGSEKAAKNSAVAAGTIAGFTLAATKAKGNVRLGFAGVTALLAAVSAYLVNRPAQSSTSAVVEEAPAAIDAAAGGSSPVSGEEPRPSSPATSASPLATMSIGS